MSPQTNINYESTRVYRDIVALARHGDVPRSDARSRHREAAAASIQRRRWLRQTNAATSTVATI